MILGDIIREYRNKNGMSMDAFSKKCGLSKAYISILERNVNPVNNKPIIPSLETIKAVSSALNLDFNDVIAMLDNDQQVSLTIKNKKGKGVKIPVLGRVQAGIPVEAIEEVIDEEEITEDLAKTGEFFGLKIKGDSMEPKFSENDIVIVKKQSDVESGDIAVVLVNGDDATIKKVKKTENGIMLIPTNPSYEPLFFDKKQIEELPVIILGKVIELRAKF